MSEDDKIVQCAFCHYRHRRGPFGESRFEVGTFDDKTRYEWLCRYCYSSILASRCLSGEPGDYTLAKDLMMGLNLLQDAMEK